MSHGIILIFLHQSLGRRAGSESDEQSLLSLPSSLESIHPTDITKQSITSTISPPFSRTRPPASLRNMYIYSIRPEHTPDTCHIGTIPVIQNGMRNVPRAFLPVPSVLTCILLYINFFAVMPTLWIFLIVLPKLDILYLPIYRNIFISTGL